jgi:hypothetical protein
LDPDQRLRNPDRGGQKRHTRIEKKVLNFEVLAVLFWLKVSPVVWTSFMEEWKF